MQSGSIVDVSGDGWHQLGWAPGALIGSPFSSLAPPAPGSDPETSLRALVDRARTGEGDIVQGSWRGPAGQHHRIELTCQLLDEGRRLLCTARDEGSRVSADRLLTHFHRLAELTDDVLLISDQRGRIVYINEAGSAKHRLSPREMVGRHVSEFVTEGEGVEARRHLIRTAMANGGRAQGQIPTIGPDGDDVIVHVNTVRDASTGLWYTIERDVTSAATNEQQIDALNNELRDAAFRDDLTGLYNARYLIDRIAQALVAGRPFAVVLLDLDNFKLLNDSLGHDHGDLLLRLAAARLTRLVRADDVVCRFGGDEFLILMESIQTGSAALDKANTIRQRLSVPYQVNGRLVHSTCSLGVTIADPQKETATDVLRNADIAAAKAKESGRNRAVLFDAFLQEKVRRRFEIESDLRRAVGDGDLDLALQGVFDARDRSLVGFESLVRWHHQELGTIPPLEFLDIAEQCGLLNDITAHVLTRSLNHLAPWLRAGNGILAVDLAASQLVTTEATDLLLDTLEHYELTPDRIMVEVSEVGLSATLSAVRPELQRLRREGFSLAIDDFGKGASSLCHLRDLPVTTVKIDSTFIHRLTHDTVASTITASIVELTNELGLSSSAEAVETEEQLEALVEMGCTLVQGYLLHRPCPPSEIDEVLRRLGPADQTEATDPADATGVDEPVDTTEPG